jgi:hypothetical protein
VGEQTKYCDTCKTEKEIRNVEELSENKRLKTLECGHTLTIIVVNENIEASEK